MNAHQRAIERGGFIRRGEKVPDRYRIMAIISDRSALKPFPIVVPETFIIIRASSPEAPIPPMESIATPPVKPKRVIAPNKRAPFIQRVFRWAGRTA